MGMYSSVRGVSRYYGNIGGWRVRRWDPFRRETVFLKFFADNTNGGTTRARLLAEEYALAHADGERLCPQHRRIRSDKTSDLPLGLSYTRRRADGTPTAIRSGMKVDGRAYFREFALSKGQKKAIAEALAYRQSLETDVFGQPTKRIP